MSNSPEEKAPEPGRNIVMRAAGLLSFAILLSRILGMLRDTVMVSQFSIGRDSDAYQLAVLIPDTIFMLVAGGGLSSAFIPIFSEFWHQDKKEEAWKLFSTVATVCFVVTSLLVGVAWWATPWIVDFFRDQKPADVVVPAVNMARIVLPAQVAFLVGSVLLATLYSRHRFLGPAIAPNVYNVGIILGGLLGPWILGMGIESMAWGALIGALIGNLVLPILLMAKEGSKFTPSFDLRQPGVGRFFILLLPVLLGFSLPSMANMVTQKFASMYRDDGINTILRYANNLMQAPLGIFGQSLALAAFPVLAQFVATDRMDLYREQISKTMRTVVYLGLPSGALMYGLADPIVHVLYGYGKASQSPAELAGIAECLRVYSFGVFAWCLQPVLMRGFFSLQKTFLPIAVGTVMTGVFIGLSWLVVTMGRPYPWLAWGSNVAALLMAVVLLFVLELCVGKLDRVGLLSTILKGLPVSALAGLLGWLAFHFIPTPNRIAEIALLAFVLPACAWVFYFGTRALKMPESDYLQRAFARRRKAAATLEGTP